ncbi:hypothetical protein QUB30_16875 [Microcoleus sp. BROC3]
MNRQDACSTKNEFSRFTGILPVLENGARCEFMPMGQGKRERQRSLE